MAVTLANVRAGMQDALSAQVIDEFCKSSYLLDNMVFDDAVTPMGGGASRQKFGKNTFGIADIG